MLTHIANAIPGVGRSGALIVNADDWGRSSKTTERTLECVLRGTVSSVSAMVFMEDSERAAAVAAERAVDAGLHLNLTTPFTARNCPRALLDRQSAIASYLNRPYASLIFHPGLVRSFEYVVAAQIDEFERRYGAKPERIDGHHHMHLCSNVVFSGLLSPGTIVRRNFFFSAGEKSLANRLFRRFIDRILVRRHRLVDFLFSLPPMDPPGRLDHIFSMASRFVIEVETHPVNVDEYQFLTGGKILQRLKGLTIARRFVVTATNRSGGHEPSLLVP